MTIRSTASEQAAIAFLRRGHPWLAFATIVLKEGSRLVLAALLVGGGVAIGSDGRIPTIVKSLLLLI